MAYTIQPDRTVVSLNKDIKIVYAKQSFLIFSWWKKVRTDSASKNDLVVNTLEQYSRFYVNGIEYLPYTPYQSYTNSTLE